MSITEFLMIFSTAIGPVMAVQITRWLDDRNEERGRKLRIFKTLMATRSDNLSSAHVEALNSIDLEFSEKNNNEKPIIDCWQAYLDHLASPQATVDYLVWDMKRVELLVKLLYAMCKYFGYDFNETRIKNATYVPQAHANYAVEQARLRERWLEVLDGKRDIPMRVTNMPGQQ